MTRAELVLRLQPEVDRLQVALQQGTVEEPDRTALTCAHATLCALLAGLTGPPSHRWIVALLGLVAGAVATIEQEQVRP